jgi:hypothetical protein
MRKDPFFKHKSEKLINCLSLTDAYRGGIYLS